MPHANQTVFFLGTAPNAFVSPFSAQLPLAFYSSIAIPGAKPEETCVPCAVTGIKKKALADFVAEISATVKVLPKAGITLTETTPEIPPIPIP